MPYYHTVCGGAALFNAQKVATSHGRACHAHRQNADGSSKKFPLPTTSSLVNVFRHEPPKENTKMVNRFPWVSLNFLFYMPTIHNNSIYS